MSKPNENPVGPAPEITTGPDGSFTETFDMIRTATRVEVVNTGEVLHSHVPKNQQVPFFDLMEQEVQIVQISIPMRMRSFWKNADKIVKLYTEISLTVTDTDNLISLRSDQGSENIQDLHNFAPWGLQGATVTKIKIDAFGGAGFRDSDIQSEGICVGDVAAWFNVPGSIRSQLYLWETPVFSKGAQFAGRFPESPWGVWFATDELSNNRLHAPVFCGSSMTAFLQSPYGKTAKYDYSKDISDVIDMINPEAKSTKVFSNAMTPGHNYKFVDRIIGTDKSGETEKGKPRKKGVKFTTDIDKEAKSLVKSIIAQNIGESYTVL